MFLKKNEIINISVEKVNEAGEAIAFYDRSKIVINGLLPGESADVKIIKPGKNVNFAIVSDIIQKNKNRVKRECKNNLCSGCDLLFCSYDYQLEIKKTVISEIYEKEISIVSSKPLAYRNKVILPVLRKDGEILIGTYRKNSHDIIDWKSECLIITPEMNAIISKVKEILADNGDSGVIEQLFIRGDINGYQAGFIIKKENNSVIDILNQLYKSGLNIVSTFFSISSGTNSVMIKDPVYVNGEKYCTLTTLNGAYKVSPQSFFQANIDTLDKILDKIKSVISNEKEGKILDLYSGCGVLSNFPGIIRTCIEVNPSSFEYIEDSSSKFITSDVGGIVSEITDGNNDIIIADPPRKGIDKFVIGAIDNSTAKIFIYLSCEPKTQKRDIDLLKNYEIIDIKGYDMFPNTMHIESLAILKRK